MKKYILSLMAVTLLALTSCVDRDSEGLTRVTTYAVLTVLGDNPAYVTLGSSYNDEGCSADLGGEDVSQSVVSESDVDTSVPGIYTVTYSAVNADGFSASASRDVYVINPGHIDNVYMSDVKYGSRHYTNLPVVIQDLGDGVYYIDDIVGGFYWAGRYPGYEPSYDFHNEGYITVDAVNGVTILDQGGWYWGITTEIATSSYNPETGVIAYDLGGDFEGMSVILTPATK